MRGGPERGEPGPRPGQGHASELVGCTAAHGGGDLVRVLTEHAHGELFAFEQHGERVGRAHHGDQDHGRIQRQGGERLTGEADDVSSRVLGGHDGHPCAEASEKPPQSDGVASIDRGVHGTCLLALDTRTRYLPLAGKTPVAARPG